MFPTRLLTVCATWVKGITIIECNDIRINSVDYLVVTM